jgi:Na+/H+-dicarboxylate symporter
MVPPPEMILFSPPSLFGLASATTFGLVVGFFVGNVFRPASSVVTAEEPDESMGTEGVCLAFKMRAVPPAMTATERTKTAIAA